MKRIISLLALFIIILLGSHAWGANTITETVSTGGYFIKLSAIDSDWTWTETMTSTVYKNGIPVWAIIFQPGAANDVLVIEDGSDAGPYIFPPVLAADTTNGKILYLNGMMCKPVLDFSDSTISAGGTVTIILDQKVLDIMRK